MKFGVSTLGCPEWSLERVAEATHEYGYQGIELRLIDGEVITPDLVRANRDRLSSLFGEGKLEIMALSSSVRFTTSDTNERAEQERTLVEFIQLAQDMHVPMVRIFGGKIPDGVPEDEGIARVAESLKRCAPAAERAGVTIALETHDDFSSSKRLSAVLHHVRSSAVGALWDSHHPYRMNEAVAEVWTNLSNRLVHVHIKDARLRPDGKWDLVLLGDGEVPCREIVRALGMRGYRGWVVVEWEKKWHPEIAEPDIAFPQHIAKLREWTQDLI